ncbi:MAG: CoA transferase [Acidimicrobiales bacterium]|jgi:formyl-CoA transferase/CoA:oxalate CoA-transferase|nr:CoA transferase [Acidimicrobiales bacterium]|tara:strand:+ start:44861 stop:46093 length:1233 start_codon:yes stop_codon:yes gene_type:complete
MGGPLENITVLDLSQGAAGPTCSMYLGDLGADVIKVEPPGGEWGRGLGPPFVEGVAAAFLGMNRNKRSIVVDLKKPDGPEVILRLAERCDIALESFRPGVADRLGTGYEAMAARNPRLIYAAISAFGQAGPWRDRPGVDGVAQAMGGIMSVTGTADGPPVKVGVPAADMAGGVFASQSILAALFSRERTGQGQRVDVSLLDSLLTYQVIPLSMFLADGQAPTRLGSAAPYAAPNEAFATSDGQLMVAAYTPIRWPALCRALGQPELATDPRFDTNEKRVRARPELRDVLEPLFRTRTTAEWTVALDDVDVICGPLLTYPELVAEEHVSQGDSLVTVQHPAVGDVRAPVFPGRLSQTPCDFTGPPPPIPGEHTEAILAENGFADSEVAELLRNGVLGDSHENEPVQKRRQR